MMQSCASAAKLRSGGPILPVGVKAKGLVGAPPPRTVIGAPSQACGQGRNNRDPSAFSVHCAGRITTPSGTTPTTIKRHRSYKRRNWTTEREPELSSRGSSPRAPAVFVVQPVTVKPPRRHKTVSTALISTCRSPSPFDILSTTEMQSPVYTYDLFDSRIRANRLTRSSVKLGQNRAPRFTGSQSSISGQR